MNKILFFIISIVWLGLHLHFFELNEVLKVADSFAYFQMAEYLQIASQQGFWTGWFGFLYSVPLAGVDMIFQNHFLSAKIVNLLCFFFSGMLVFSIGKKILDPKYALLTVILFYVSPILLHFNIAILSENIYILIFLLLFSSMLNMMKAPKISDGIGIGFFLALMYYTRGEAFIYLWSIACIALYLLCKKKIELKQDFWESEKHKYRFTLLQAVSFWVVVVISFGLFISPYVYHLHTLTWEWGISNKWSSNLRQAILRWKETMDDSWFEKAVAELTPDNKNIIAWFAWGLSYNPPSESISLKTYIFDDPERFVSNWWQNQKKLYTQNMPHILLWDAAKLYYNEWSDVFYKNKLFFIILLIPLMLFVIWICNIFRRKNKDFIVLLWSFFVIASIFFTLFFTLNRYFLIFFPLFLVIIVYWIQTIDSFITFTFTWFRKKSIDKKNVSTYKLVKIVLSGITLWIYVLWLSVYYNTYASRDEYYTIKKEAWIWLSENAYSIDMEQRLWKSTKIEKTKTDNNKKFISEEKFLKNINILERFPVVTYYSWTQNRWITPYTSSLEALLEYADYNNIDYLIVDTLDFQKYRPELSFLLDETKEFNWLKKVHVERSSFDNKIQKVIIYKIK